MTEQTKRISERLELMTDTETLLVGHGRTQFHAVTVSQQFFRRTVLRV
jgi:hypothetical protein